MSKSFSESYRAAGVDVTAGYRAVDLMKRHVSRTCTPEVLDTIGGFGGMLMPDLTGIAKPVLVSGTDGVGTKLKIAFLMDKHDTVGIDCVAMCVNDVVCCGASPCSSSIISRWAKMCRKRWRRSFPASRRAVCSLAALWSAAKPPRCPASTLKMNMTSPDFRSGIVDQARILTPDLCRKGDVLIALASSGVHSNGFSLVRKVFDIEKADLNAYESELGRGLGETLLTPTKLYVKAALAAIAAGGVRSIAHITGGGFYENIPRALPEGLCAKIEKQAVEVLPIFPG